MGKKITAPDIMAAKGKKKICVLTAYDYPTGVWADSCGADMVLVGDSLAMVALGREDTLSVTMDEMIHHTRATVRGVENALVIGDMPFMSYQPSVELAVANAGRFLSEGGARSVKVEGGAGVVPHIKAMTASGVPVMGHIGLTPQHIANLGGFKAQGKTAKAVRILLSDAMALEKAGCFSIVLEAVPVEAAKLITESLSIPTIGIGAGNVTDGQVLVTNDVLGVFDRFTPKFVKKYSELGREALAAMSMYCEEVRSGTFPSEEHTFHLPDEEFVLLKRDIEK